jgi:2,4-dienoyl-CoA reductase-like NADH-dependent reductase (Old Yellow Enzyme family)
VTDIDAAAHPRFPHVFTPLRLRHRTLRARINLGAHTTNMGEDGLPAERHLAYYRERALGGAGMIVVEPMPVHPTGVLTRGNFRPGDDSVIPAFRRLTESCHDAAAADGGVVMIHQLYHVGQHGDADNSFAPSWSPSGLPSYHDADGSHAVTEPEIDELLDGFVSAARRAQQAGFDGVELFAAYHALIDQFWTPWSNRRTDRWGGSFDNRMRFSATLLERIRRECGDDFIVGLAVNMDPESAPSLSLEELQEVVAWHDQRGLMDYVTCGTGSYFDFAPLMPTSLYPPRLGEPFAAALKAVTTHALVQAESHIRTPAAAEEVLAAGHADMVSIVRGQIADPHLVAKARTGRQDEVRPCISCNQLCWGRRSRDYWISCLVNPSTGREHEWGGDRFVPASARKQVLVVGGGPAGLEAARVAAERGHRVALREAGDELGGQWRLAGRQPTRTQVLDHLAWYERELTRLDVDVRVGQMVDAGQVGAAGADEIVVAIGARPARAGFQRALPMVDRLPGIDHPRVAGVEEVLDGDAAPEGRVLLVDDLGDWRGIGTALFLQEKSGCQVTLLTSAPAVASGLFHSAADIPTRRRFARNGGETATHAVLASWAGGTAVIRSTLTDDERTVAFDWLVVAETPTPRSGLSTELDASGVRHHRIGDCVAARRASLAIYEGRRLGLSL